MKTFEMEVTYNFKKGGQAIHQFTVEADNKKEAIEQIERLAKAQQREEEDSKWDDSTIEYGELCEEF